MEWGVHGGSQEVAGLHGKGIGSAAGVYEFSNLLTPPEGL